MPADANEATAERHAEVRFSITEEDVRELRDFRPGRRRDRFLEGYLHKLAAFVALHVVLLALVFRQPHRLPMYLGIVACLWLAAWAWLVFVLLRRSPRSKAWLERLRTSPVLTKGDCVVSLPEEGTMQVMSTGGTRTITSKQVEDLIYSGTSMYVGTTAGQAVIIPRRAFGSDEAFADFARKLPHPPDEESDKR